MNSVEFLKNKIKVLVEDIPYIQCRYEVDEFSQSHYVEVTPSDVYRKDKRFIEGENKVSIEFIEKYPFENLTFLSSGDIFEVEHPILTCKGKDFVQIEEFSYLDYSSSINEYKDFTEFNIDASKARLDLHFRLLIDLSRLSKQIEPLQNVPAFVDLIPFKTTKKETTMLDNYLKQLSNIKESQKFITEFQKVMLDDEINLRSIAYWSEYYFNFNKGNKSGSPTDVFKFGEEDSSIAAGEENYALGA